MRKITKESIQAFIRKGELNKQNMSIYSDNGISYMRLHGNLIATLEWNNLKISTCGWYSNTTKERLNGLLSKLTNNRVYIFQKNWCWYLSNNGVISEFKDGMKLDLTKY